MADAAWYRTFFDEDYLRRYGPHFTAEGTERQVDGIIDLLGYEPPARILDLACGHGRHAIPLAGRGYQVTGFDLSGVFLEQARADARNAGVDVEFVQGDMRELPFEAEFDAVINIFTAFGYLESDEEDQKAVACIARALQPGGIFLLETIHRDNLIGRFSENFVERHDDGLVVVHKHTFDLEQSRLVDEILQIEPDGTRTELSNRVRSYTIPEYRKMFEAAGLELVSVYGGLTGDPLTLSSRRLVLMALKPL